MANKIDKKNVTIDDMFPKDHITGGDIGEGKAYVMIVSDYDEKKVFNQKQNKTKIVWTLRFKGANKPLILNVTNAKVMVELSGSRSAAAWVGKKVELYAEWVNAFGEDHLVVRLRKPTGKASAGEIVPDGATGLNADEQKYYDYAFGTVGMSEDNADLFLEDRGGDHVKALGELVEGEKQGND